MKRQAVHYCPRKANRHWEQDTSPTSSLLPSPVPPVGRAPSAGVKHSQGEQAARIETPLHGHSGAQGGGKEG